MVNRQTTENARAGALSTMARRHADLISFLESQSHDALQLAASLKETAERLREPHDCSADDIFADGINHIHNFLMNIKLSQSIRLASRFAAAEEDYNHVLMQ